MKEVIEFDFNNKIIDDRRHQQTRNVEFTRNENISPNKSSSTSNCRYHDLSELPSSMRMSQGYSQSLRCRRVPDDGFNKGPNNYESLVPVFHDTTGLNINTGVQSSGSSSGFYNTQNISRVYRSPVGICE